MDEATSLMTTYQSLEEHVMRLENPDSSSGSNNQDLATRVKLARGAFCSRVNNVISMLTQHLVALTNTINDTKPGNEVILGRSWDLKDSAERSIEKLQRQIRRWEKQIFRAGINLSPVRNKILDMGKKKTEVKRKSDKEIVNTDLVTKWSGQPDETGKSGGQTPIKIKLKRLASPLRPHAIYGNSRPLHPTSEHNPADMYSHEPHGEPPVINPVMEAILPSCPFISTETQDIIPDCRTPDTHGYTGNPDSTSDA